MRQADVDDLRAGIFQPLDALLPERFDFCRHAINAVLAWNADLEPLYVAGHRRFVVRNRQVDARGIERIVAGHRFQHDRAVTHGARHRSRLVQRRREGDNAPARAASIGWLDACNACDGRRLTDGSTRIRTRGAHDKARRDRGGRTARRSAGHKFGVGTFPPPGIDDGAIVARLIRRPHGKLVHVQLAEHDSPVIEQVAGHGGLIGRLEPVKDVRSRRGQHVLRAEQVLDAQRNAIERTRRSGSNALVAFRRCSACDLRCFGHEGIQRPRLLDGPDVRVRQFGCRERLLLQPVAGLGDRQVGELAHSTTFGTAK